MDTAVAGGALDTLANRMTPDTGISSMTPATPAPVSGVILMTAARPRHGTIIVDGSGRTLYVLNHAPTDTTIWRPVMGTAAPTSTDTAIKSSALGTTNAANGTMQATYDGKPLYYYSRDTTANDMSGEGKTEGGATGHVIRADKH